MMYLETQRGKEGMKTKRLNAELGTTAGCTVRAMESFPEATGIKGDAWFGSVLCASELAVRGFQAVLQVKQNHGLYPKAIIEEALNNAPGGVSIILKGTAPNEQVLYAIGYKYSSKKVLFFVITSKAGSTTPGTPYEMKYTDPHGNVCTRLVERPKVISDFFADSNKIDSHNQARQFELGLEKSWVTHDPYFRLATTLLGFSVVDAWKLGDYHRLFNWSRKTPIGIRHFAGILAKQLIVSSSHIAQPVGRFASSFSELRAPLQEIPVDESLNSATVSSMSPDEPKILIPIRTLVDCNGQSHHQVSYPVSQQPNGRKCTKKRNCKNCQQYGIRQAVRFYCFTCGLSSAYCCEEDNDCFLKHVSNVKSNRSRRSTVC
jgi:hypothetical protein